MKRIHISFYSLVSVLLVIGIIIFACLPFVLNGEEKKYKIAVIMGSSQSDGWDTYIAGLFNACEDYSSDVYIVPTNGFLGTDKVIKMAMEQVRQGADALVLQSNDGTLLSGSLSKLPFDIPVVIVDGYDSTPDMVRDCRAFMGFDNIAVGKSLAGEAEKVFSTGIADKKIGIISSSTKQYNIEIMRSSLENEIANLGGTIAWEYEYNGGDEKYENLIQQKIYKYPIDILIALDNDSLEAAIRCKTGHMNNSNIAMIGVGTSSMVLYHLDTGVVDALIVPDYFAMGYSTVRQINAKLEAGYADFKDETHTFRIIYRDTMFNDEQQKYLFGIN